MAVELSLASSNTRLTPEYPFPYPTRPCTASNFQVTGIFFESKVDYTTWFGGNVEYIHGIQVIYIAVRYSPNANPSVHNHIQETRDRSISNHLQSMYPISCDKYIEGRALPRCCRLLRNHPQNIPVTAITEHVRDPQFCHEEWHQVG